MDQKIMGYNGNPMHISLNFDKGSHAIFSNLKRNLFCIVKYHSVNIIYLYQNVSKHGWTLFKAQFLTTMNPMP